MFADNAVLLSKTPEGLQHALGNVQEDCDNWRLKINAHKTKVMIFNKSGRLAKEKFTLGVDLLENAFSPLENLTKHERVLMKYSQAFISYY